MKIVGPPWKEGEIRLEVGKVFCNYCLSPWAVPKTGLNESG